MVSTPQERAATDSQSILAAENCTPVYRKGAPLAQRQYCLRTCQARKQDRKQRSAQASCCLGRLGARWSLTVSRRVRGGLRKHPERPHVGTASAAPGSGQWGTAKRPVFSSGVPSLSLERCLVSIYFLSLIHFLNLRSVMIFFW